MHPGVLRKLAGVFVEPFSMILEKSWQSGEVPNDWKRKKAHFQKGWTGGAWELETHQPHHCDCGKIMEQMLLAVVLRHVEDREVI